MQQTKQNQKTSEAQVRHVLRELCKVYPQAKEQPGSGNTAWAPNDIHVAQVMQIECKATVSKSISIKLDWVERARQLCLRNGLRSMLALSIAGYHYYMVDEATMLHLLACEKAMDEKPAD